MWLAASRTRRVMQRLSCCMFTQGPCCLHLPAHHTATMLYTAAPAAAEDDAHHHQHPKHPLVPPRSTRAPQQPVPPGASTRTAHLDLSCCTVTFSAARLLMFSSTEASSGSRSRLAGTSAVPLPAPVSCSLSCAGSAMVAGCSGARRAAVAAAAAAAAMPAAPAPASGTCCLTGLRGEGGGGGGTA